MGNKEGTKKILAEIILTETRLDKAYYDFLRNVITISTAFLGLLVGMKPVTLPGQTSQVLFLITISTIGFGILSCIVVLYYEVGYLKEEKVQKHKLLHAYIESDGEKTSFAVQINRPKIYAIFEKLGFGCLSISIPTLIAYVFFLEFGC